MKELKELLEDKGFKVFCVPEVPTMVNNNKIKYIIDIKDNAWWRDDNNARFNSRCNSEILSLNHMISLIKQ